MSVYKNASCPDDVAIKYGNGTYDKWSIINPSSSIFKIYSRYMFPGESFHRVLDQTVRSNIKTGTEAFYDSSNNYLNWQFEPVYSVGNRIGYYYTGNFDKFSAGQCTWYCYGRAKEKCGVTLTFTQPSGNDARNWYDGRFSGSEVSDNFPKGQTIRYNSISVQDNHVRFVEWVEYDSSGNPVTAYYSDANAPQDDTLDTRDGQLKSTSYSSFSSGVLGYIYINSPSSNENF